MTSRSPNDPRTEAADGAQGVTLLGLGARFKDNRTVFIALTVTLVLITAAYYLILRGRDNFDPALVNNQILLFFLRNVNAVLVTALGFVLLRNMTKLWLEYRGRKLGAKLKTKLVLTYIGLSLMPVILLFALATEVVQGSLDAVFRTSNSDLLEPGSEVSLALTAELERRNQINAELVLDATGDLKLSDSRSQPELDEILRDRLDKLGLDVVYAFQETEFAHAVINPTSGIIDLPDIDSQLLLAALRGGRTSQGQDLDTGGRLLLGAAATPDASAIRTIIVAGTVLPEALKEQTKLLIEANQAGLQVQVQESEIRAVQTLSFLMVTLALLLICSWVGLYLARQITVPIQALADGTKRVAEGDLAFRVEAPADDELGVLVASFNQMTGELQSSKNLLEESNRELSTSNSQLEHARQRIGTVLRSVATGVISVDENGHISTCNDAAGQMLTIDPRSLEGLSLEEAMEKHTVLRTLLGAEHHTAQPGQAILSSSIQRSECRVAINDVWKTFEVTTTPLRDQATDESTTSTNEQDSNGTVIVLEDLTELIQAQKLATWNEAARRIAHEIKNPLTPIKLSAERLLKKHQDQDPAFGETLNDSTRIIVREVEKMKNLVDEFARFARMPRPSLKNVDVGALCREVVLLYNNIKADVDVVAEVSGTGGDEKSGALTAAVDEEQLRSALTNLIDNAVEATEGPGTIHVRAETTESGIRLQVADPGPGVPAADKERLFLPYYSTKGRGTGLGLSIVHRIVTDHHGTIRVDDNEPCGAVFSIDIPR